jgi:hypothetical protein
LLTGGMSSPNLIWLVMMPMGAVFLRRASAVRNELRLAQEELDQLRGFSSE